MGKNNKTRIKEYIRTKVKVVIRSVGIIIKERKNTQPIHNRKVTFNDL